METADEKPLLVVGDRGLLGRELMRSLRRTGPVKGVDRSECDIVDPLQVSRVLDEIQPARLINAAAYTDVDGSENNRSLAWAVNATGAGNLARACRDRQIPMVQLSTDFIFDGKKRSPYREDDAPRPLSFYGRSKLGGEEEVRSSSSSYLIVRTSWLFGKGGKNFVDTILAKARIEDSIPVVSDQVGAPTYAVDLAEAITNLIKRNASGTVNVTNRGSCAWSEYANFVMKTAGLKTRIIPTSAAKLSWRAERPAYSVLDLAEYESITGEKMRRWEEAVREYVRAVISNQ